MLAFWMGGAALDGAVVPPVVVSSGVSRLLRSKRKQEWVSINWNNDVFGHVKDEELPEAIKYLDTVVDDIAKDLSETESSRLKENISVINERRIIAGTLADIGAKSIEMDSIRNDLSSLDSELLKITQAINEEEAMILVLMTIH